MFRLLALGFVAFFSNAALAAPPSSCAAKFVGTWSYAGGTTTVNADGTANPHCLACVSVQTWTCQGNTYLFSNSGPPGQFSATLVDPTHMQGSGVIATRVGAAPAVAGQQASKPKAGTESPQEPGLIEGNRLGRLTTRAKREAYDIAQQMLTTAMAQWLDRANENLDLKERIRDKAAAMNNAAAEGRWRQAQHEYDTLKPLIAEAKKRGLKLSSRFDALFR
ncbi:hypothetical protein [Methyloceanibacter sp.]|uniref:hypothetical protein n=1 Tax=Methyloceanibacter sp. TaxID=1965321 RepID=UPI003D6CC3A6